MLTKIDLCSMALLKLGEAPIQSMTEDSAAANVARHLYDSTVDSLLASHPWRFAQEQYKLLKTSDGDFIIPSSVLRILKCDGEIIRNTIKYSGNVASVLAISKTNSENFPAYFASLAATKLAVEFCVPLTGDQNMFRTLAALYDSELRAARFIDSTMSASADISDFSLISARY
jgi:hypothetical protein